ncbi:MAG: cytochrome c3 family protein [Polyangiaceae bacterium]|nr:cytochrome c3 family protein [Polyangiaceae bacterium]
MLTARIAAALVIAAPLLAGCDTGSIGSQQGYEPVQPIAFSHATHAGEAQMSCQYCHYGAERSRHAGVPSASVCMNCHTQVKKDSPEIAKIKSALDSGTPIQWVRVHRLPDYAFFDHAGHTRAGVACQNCHGPVETMVRVSQVETMSMGFCLDCHRTTAAQDPALQPPTDCAACHH